MTTDQDRAYPPRVIAGAWRMHAPGAVLTLAATNAGLHGRQLGS